MAAAPPLPPSQPPGQVPAASVLPPDHQLGMKVPKGGSMCANCDYLADPQTCGNPGFVKWNGSGQLPAPADEYCCDLYSPGEAAPAGPTGPQGDPQDMMVAALKGGQGNAGQQ
jgi:hypothetical protein